MQATKSPGNKVERYRQRMRAAGMRPVQFWVPDTRAGSFVERVRNQCLKLKADPHEQDILHFSEAAAQEIEGWQ